MDKIFLNGMKFYSYHGVFEEEQRLGQIFIVDLELQLDLQMAGQTDDLSETVNYGEVFELVEAEMDVHSKLLEHVAERTIQKLLQTYTTVHEITMRITKQNPPINGHYDGVGIEINRKR